MPIVLRPPILRGGSSKIALMTISTPGAQGGQVGVLGYQRLPGEALYNVNLTLQNIVAGSSVLITDLSDVEIARATATGGNTVLSMPFYGSNQSVKVIVRKSTTSPIYQSFETQAVITAVGASVFVSQISDE